MKCKGRQSQSKVLPREKIYYLFMNLKLKKEFISVPTIMYYLIDLYILSFQNVKFSTVNKYRQLRVEKGRTRISKLKTLLTLLWSSQFITLHIQTRQNTAALFYSSSCYYYYIDWFPSSYVHCQSLIWIGGRKSSSSLFF